MPHRRLIDKIKPVFITINLDTFEVNGYGNKSDVASLLGVHRNTLIFKKDRRTIGNTLIVAVKIK